MAGTSASSLIDVVDPLTGQPVATATRSEALRRGLPVRTVHAFLLDDERRLLLQELGSGRDRHALLWGSSVAAFPRPGEREDVAVTRRAEEELGLTVPLRRVGSVQAVDGASPKFVALYEGRIDHHPEILEREHVERVEFWSLERIDTALRQNPSRFTGTFRQVYDWWRDRSNA